MIGMFGYRESFSYFPEKFCIFFFFGFLSLSELLERERKKNEREIEEVSKD